MFASPPISSLTAVLINPESDMGVKTRTHGDYEWVPEYFRIDLSSNMTLDYVEKTYNPKRIGLNGGVSGFLLHMCLPSLADLFMSSSFDSTRRRPTIPGSMVSILSVM